MERTILHVDLNNFYASVECLYNPELRDKPIAVCGSQDQRHGIVLAKNQIAKGYGVRTGEAIWQAHQKCPGLVTVKPNYNLYLRFSKAAREVYAYYTDLIENFGIDECWLDVTASTKLFGNGEKIAHEIRQRVKDELGITVSIGVSYNKIFAKLGSDYKKPDAVTVINQSNFRDLVWKLPVGELLYVGPSTRKKLYNINMFYIGSLATASLPFLKKQFGKWGETLWYFANGFDASPVTKTNHDPMVKSIGNSMTTAKNLENNEDVKLTFYVLAESVAERLRKHNFKCQTIQIYIRDNTLDSIERQAKLSLPSFLASEIAEKSMDIFLHQWTWTKPIRSLGIRAADLVTADHCIQLSLLNDINKRIRLEALEESIDAIRSRFGHYSVERGLMLFDRRLNANPIEENIVFPVSYFR